ncbi:MAG: prepilin-type N-terminal cleavage/methylation domain-containing protein [Bacteroidales bacterium]|nr:prepilin-type N-terminal cleavage/methylation domain-containing protein [Bacteroidales bacterium]
MIRNAQTRRRGFSLVELIVVMGILATLAILAVGTYNRLRGGQNEAATESTLSKLNNAMDVRYAQIVNDANRDAAKDNFPTGLREYCNNDPDIARSALVYLNLLKAFPTSHAEATTTFQLVTPAPLKIYQFRPNTVFSAVANAGTAEEQSAACLYIALTSSTDAASGTLDQQTGQTAAGTVFRDAWNRPIAFSRLTYATELNSPPWYRGTGASKDPADPLGKLSGLGGKLNAEFWPNVAGRHWNYTGFPSGGYPGTGANWVMTAISAGPDKTATASVISDPKIFLSYRLRREGQKAGN